MHPSEKLELELLDASTRRSKERLAELLDEAFVEVGASGKTFTKADIVSRLPQEVPAKFVVSDLGCFVLDERITLITYTIEIIRGDQRYISKRSSVWIYDGNGWRMRYHQGTAVENRTAA